MDKSISTETGAPSSVTVVSDGIEAIPVES